MNDLGFLSEVEADVQLLLECMKCQADDPSSLKQALTTFATICSSKGML